MPALTVRQLDEGTYNQFKAIAAEAGRSMEAEVRDMIEQKVHSHNWWQRWVDVTKDLRGDDIPVPPRSMPKEPPDFT